jgi:pyruvate,water dikinase
MPSSPSPRLPLWLPLAAADATLDLAGGKGASLARLAAAGLPVPDGFVLTTAAYRRVVEAGRLQARIVEAASSSDAEATIRALFASVSIPDDVLRAIYAGCASIGADTRAVAVRSSATAEDLPGLSFAGQQDTFLNVHGEHDLVEAIRRCWGSLWTARAISYRARARIAPEDVSLAVVVQLLVPADAAGVLFTVDPISGAPDRMTINATWGLGESLVSGQVTPDTLIVDRHGGAIVRQTVGDKSVMTVATGTGTREEPVPQEQRRQPVLTPDSARALAHLGQRIEDLYGRPMDIEWALQRGQIAILQARPITTPVSETEGEEWNESLGHDFLWSSANLGEAVPDVMTPATWSLFQRFIYGAMQANFTAGFSPVGTIGGRLYMNLSLTATQAAVIFMSRKTLVGLLEQAFGRIPDDVEIPRIPISRRHVLRDLIPAGLRLQTRVRRNLKRFDAVVSSVPGRVEAVLRHIEEVATPEQLRLVWFAELAPLLDDASAMLEAATRRDSGALLRARQSVSKLVGDADTDLLLTGALTGGRKLASLEPLLGLEQVARGELSRETYARKYGHRGPHEFEVSLPRPAEDPDWIDRQLAGLRAAPTDVSGLLERRRAAADGAWQRLAQRYPRKLEAVRKDVARIGWGLRAREAARSEVVRVFWPLRAFYARAGALLGRSDDVFFVSYAELVRVLAGDATPLASVARRKAGYARYAALPPYPVLIRGPFDPFAWAADSNRRSDVYDATSSRPSVAAEHVLVGFPGAPGSVEGVARVLASPEEADALRPGEILVTTVTNVGWTPIFPRAAAIVTDVGAPLSHAAIVARELGIPAVVGTGTATQRIRTGERVTVDGAGGTVTLPR